MWLKRVEIKNVRALRDVDVTLKRGAIAIVGRNGAGKSTFLELAYGCLTNDFTRFPVTRANMLCDWAGAGERSYVRVTAEAHNGTEFTVERRFDTDKESSKLTLKGQETIKAANKVEAELAKLGVDQRLLNLAGFRRQNEIGTFMSATPAERSLAYQVLTGAEHCKANHKMLGDEIQALQQRVVDLQPHIDAASADVAKLEADLESLQNDKLKAEQAVLGENKRKRLTEAVGQAALLAEWRKERKKKLGELEDKTGELEGSKTDLAKARKRLARLQLPERSAVEAARKELKAWQAWLVYARPLKELHDRKQSLAQRKPLKEVKAPAVDVATLTEKRGELAAKYKNLKERRAALKLPSAICPTCGTSFKDKRQEVERQIKELDRGLLELEAEGKDVKVAIEAATTAATNYRDYTQEKRRRESDDESFEADCQKLLAKRVEKPKGKYLENARAAHGVVKRWDALSGKAEELGKEIARLEPLVDAHQVDVDRLTKERKELLTKIKGVDEEAAQVAQTALDADAEAQGKVKELEGSLATTRRMLKEARDELARHQAENAKHAGRRTDVAILTRVRDVIHWESLPQLLAAEAQARMVPLINDRLEAYAAPFWVGGRADLDFDVRFDDREPKTARDLSVGQGVILAISFWDALARVFQSRLGLLALDEPTANLDDENVKGLARSLDAMKTAIKGKRQILIVTHNDQLKPSFDQVVQL